MHALFATYIQNITTLPYKMANDDKTSRPLQSVLIYKYFVNVCHFAKWCYNILNVFVKYHMHLAGNLESFLTLHLR